MVAAASSDGSTVILGRAGSEGSDRTLAWLMEGSTPKAA